MVNHEHCACMRLHCCVPVYHCILCLCMHARITGPSVSDSVCAHACTNITESYEGVCYKEGQWGENAYFTEFYGISVSTHWVLCVYVSLGVVFVYTATLSVTDFCVHNLHHCTLHVHILMVNLCFLPCDFPDDNFGSSFHVVLLQQDYYWRQREELWVLFLIQSIAYPQTSSYSRKTEFGPRRVLSASLTVWAMTPYFHRKQYYVGMVLMCNA